MAFQKTITEAVAVSGLHTLTVSDVANLYVGYSIDVQGVGNTFDGTHTITAIDDKPLIVADGETGKAVWFGTIEEHGQPAWAAITPADVHTSVIR